MFLKIFLLNKKILIVAFLLLILFIYFILYFSNTVLLASTYNNESDKFIDSINNIFEGNEKVAYLTFDDGPNPSITPKILDILEKENIKATFFVIGKKVEEYPKIVNRAYKEGHYIANHGYSHNNSLLYKNTDSFINEIEKTDLAIGNAIGISNYCSHVFRFPNGFMSNIYKDKKNKYVNYLADIGYTYIDWNALNKDSEQKYTKEQLLNNLISSSKTKNTLVILMHDTNDVNDSSIVLKDSIDYLKSQGYEFRNFYNLK